MSQENVEDVFEDPIEDQVEEAEEQEIQEEKPAPRGYMTKEAWIEAGRDPEEWVSPEVFKERGERIKMKQEMQRDFDNRLRNLKLLHDKNLEIQREEILAKRDLAIDTADKDAVKKYDKKLKELDDIEELNREDEQAQQQKPREVIEWEEENPWCNDVNDPRLIVAQNTYSSAIKAGKTVATALRLVDKTISEKFLDTKKRPAQVAESSRPSPSRGDDVKPTMANLTATERKIWESGIFDDQKEFLKAVADDRKAGRK